MLRGRRFPRVRRGRRLLSRSGFRRTRRTSQLRRTRRASTSTRSSGNVGKNYTRVSRRIVALNSRQFPPISSYVSERFAIAWYTGTGSTSRGVQIYGATGVDLGTITNPGSLAPGVNTVPLPYVIAGYYSLCLDDFSEFSGDNFRNYREYRIKSFRITLTSRQPVFTAVAGVAHAAYGPGGTEVMLVNTGKSGEFVLNCPLNDNAHIITQENNPWNQVLNRSNVKEISVKKTMSSNKPTTISMKVDCMETYLVNEPIQYAIMAPTADIGIEPDRIPVYPYQTGTSVGAIQEAYGTFNGRFQYKRRRFRWTRQWLQWWNPSGVGNQVMYIRNDRKRADGVQVMIRDNTFMQATIPYFNVNITAQLEFRNPSIVPADQTSTEIGSIMLFPFTNATYDHT